MITGSFTSATGVITLAINTEASNVTAQCEITELGSLTYEFDQTPDQVSIDRVQALYSYINVTLQETLSNGLDTFQTLLADIESQSNVKDKIDVELTIDSHDLKQYKFIFVLRFVDISFDERARLVRLRLSPKFDDEILFEDVFSEITDKEDAIVKGIDGKDNVVVDACGVGTFIDQALKEVFDDSFDNELSFTPLLGENLTNTIYSDTFRTNGTTGFVMLDIASKLAGAEQVPVRIDSQGKAKLDQYFFDNKTPSGFGWLILDGANKQADFDVIEIGDSIEIELLYEGTDNFGTFRQNRRKQVLPVIDKTEFGKTGRAIRFTPFAFPPLFVVYPLNTDKEYDYTIIKKGSPDKIPAIDLLKDLAGIEGSVFGTGFSKNFYFSRTTESNVKTLNFDEVLNAKPIPKYLPLGNSTVLQLASKERVGVDNFGLWPTELNDEEFVYGLKVPNLSERGSVALGNKRATKELQIVIAPAYPFLNKATMLSEGGIGAQAATGSISNINTSAMPEFEGMPSVGTYRLRIGQLSSANVNIESNMNTTTTRDVFFDAISEVGPIANVWDFQKGGDGIDFTAKNLGAAFNNVPITIDYLAGQDGLLFTSSPTSGGSDGTGGTFQLNTFAESAIDDDTLEAQLTEAGLRNYFQAINTTDGSLSIEFTIRGALSVFPWDVIQFDSRAPEKYRDKQYRATKLSYNFVLDEVQVTAYQINGLETPIISGGSKDNTDIGANIAPTRTVIANKIQKLLPNGGLSKNMVDTDNLVDGAVNTDKISEVDFSKLERRSESPIGWVASVESDSGFVLLEEQTRQLLAQFDDASVFSPMTAGNVGKLYFQTQGIDKVISLNQFLDLGNFDEPVIRNTVEVRDGGADGTLSSRIRRLNGEGFLQISVAAGEPVFSDTFASGIGFVSADQQVVTVDSDTFISCSKDTVVVLVDGSVDITGLSISGGAKIGNKVTLFFVQPPNVVSNIATLKSEDTRVVAGNRLYIPADIVVQDKDAYTFEFVDVAIATGYPSNEGGWLLVSKNR